MCMKVSDKTTHSKFDPSSFEKKWQQYWEAKAVFSPNLDEAKQPYYNLMMFPYPSAEGMHVGNMYAHTGADIHGRFKRMQGFDVFEPIGLDGFGIHSENFAMKVGRHPKEQTKRAQENFYRQMHETGSAFDWQRTLETYDPGYYKWTQWLFTEMFKAGLAYRSKALVNYCPSCKTVLSDEQVISGECERCGSRVERRALEQWFFRITDYAGRLLDNIDDLDWSEKVKIAQKNWIGRSTGALIRFPVANFVLPNGEKPNFVLLHGFNGGAERNFMPWLKNQLEKLGYRVQVPELPNTSLPKEQEQVEYVVNNVTFDKNTVMLGHSLGTVVALKVVEKLQTQIAGLVLVGGFVEPKFKDGTRPYSSDFSWEFDWESIRSKVDIKTVVFDESDPVIPYSQTQMLAQHLEVEPQAVKTNKGHFRGKVEGKILSCLIPMVEVFTTRPDTLFGATFMVIAPEHPIVKQVIDLEYKVDEKTRKAVGEYVAQAALKTDIERTAENKPKTGVFSGLFVVNPVSGEKMPVWIADYVLAGYGTGAIMAVPAHDERDFAFAKTYDLPIEWVVTPPKSQTEAVINKDESIDQIVYVGEGLLQNSGEWDGYHSKKDSDKILNFIAENGIGEAETQYHLRDWLISRQRYWGPPIPMIYCENCAQNGISWFDTEEAKEYKARISQDESLNNTLNSKKEDSLESRISNLEFSRESAGWYPVPLQQLPVVLPDIEDFKPLGTGKAPLANHPEFYETVCPRCGAPARRETDVSDTFLDSAWYFLRYLATDWDKLPFPSVTVAQQLGAGSVEGSPAKRSGYLPVTIYIGGAEHAVLHLLYARFMTMVLHDLNYLDFEEPFRKFVAHGLLIKEGAKMSKSKGNVIVPDEYIAKYGADTLRSYLMFLGPFSQGGDFYDSGIEGMYRFLRRVWYLCVERVVIGTVQDDLITRAVHKTIKGVSRDMENFGYNTALAKLMELYNTITDGKSENERIALTRETVESMLKLLAPFAPHMTEEIWHSVLGYDISIHVSEWPIYQEELTMSREVVVVVQVNGKRRGEIVLPISDVNNQNLAEEKAKVEVAQYLTNQTVKKVIFVPGKIINFVV